MKRFLCFKNDQGLFMLNIDSISCIAQRSSNENDIVIKYGTDESITIINVTFNDVLFAIRGMATDNVSVVKLY